MVRKFIPNRQMNVHRTVLERFISSCSYTSTCKCSSDQDMYKKQAFPHSQKFEIRLDIDIFFKNKHWAESTDYF